MDAVTAANTDTGKDAGKLFGKDGGDAAAGDASKAAAAVSGVSGEQILKQIVDAAGKEDGDQNGAAANTAANPIAAAIGTAEAGAFAKEGMKKDDQIAAAIVLRGMAKGGKFGLNADDDAGGKGGVKNAVESAVKEVSELLEKLITAGKEVVKVDFGDGSIGNVVAQAQAGAADKDSVKGIAKGIKGIVEAAGEKLDAVTAANTETGTVAGKLFGKDGGNAAAADASKAATAVSGVSGEQILKQIVDAAGKGDGDQNGVKAADAANPIAAAIGTADAGAAFNTDGMKKDDQIAAAIVLRGMAKGGKFALAADNDTNGKGGVKNAVESAVKEVSELLEKLITAGKEVVKVDYFGNDSIGNVVAQANGGAADGNSVKGIAKGIKGIVDAAGGKLDAVTAANTETGKDAGKLFGNGGAAANAEAASKAATAISGVSGEQILKQIVDAAGKEDQNGAGAAAAANPIAAAIGTDEGAGAAAFNANGMKKDDQIAAAIVLRGMAKDGKFGLTAADDTNGKGGVKNAVESAVKLLEKLITAGKEVVKVDFGNDSIGNVVAQADGGAADGNSVKGIAKGIKGIVDAAGGKLDAVAAANTDTGKDAGKLFGKDGGNAAAADASKAATAVSGVSGEQILKQIVDAAGKGDGDQNGAAANTAANPIAAAIGTADNGAAFNTDGMTKDDQIAAAIVLRGMAKDGKFGLNDNTDANGKGGVKNAVESAVKLLEKLITAGKEVEKVDFGNDSIGNVVVQAQAG
ncbi:variable large family protein, partial [Borreliella bavariensis]|uniref:variable large family protein n=1 Tax=Borreliella bavariensis TaxID=664662 RepID=UPI001CB75946